MVSLLYRAALPTPRLADLHHALQLFGVQKTTVLPPSSELKFEVSSNELSRSGEWLEVFWSGLHNPQRDDLVALYIPADADPKLTAPAKYKWLSKADTHLSSGNGTLRFRLINYRADMRFALIRNGLEYPRIVAWSEVIRLKNPNEPHHGHLALTANPREMSVQWTSRDRSQPQVRWGWQAGVYSAVSPARSSSYSREDLCGEPATTVGWQPPGLLHSAVLRDLVPGRRYYYSFGDEDYGFSPEYTFVAAPDASPEATVKVLAVADLGQSEVDGSNEWWQQIGSLQTLRHLLQDAATHSLLIHNGDISYACGYATQWDVYMEMMEPLVTQLPYMTLIGNHERDWPGTGDRYPSGVRDSGGECGIPTERRLQMPQAGPDKPWYSYDYGPVHLLQYSTEHDFGIGSEQRAFIVEDLKALNRSRTPWLLVNGHRPMYVDSTYAGPPDSDQVVAAELRDSLEDLFAAHTVDLTLHGHHHSYQRSCFVLSGKCIDLGAEGVAQAPLHLVMGHAGAPLTYNTAAQPDSIWQLVNLTHGYLRISANATNFDVEVVESTTGSVFDSFGLRKPMGWVPRNPATFQQWRPDRAAPLISCLGSASGRAGSTWLARLWAAAKGAFRLCLRSGASGGASSSLLAWGLPHDHLQARIALQAA
eukprot:jgi/Botrbrau1/22572/Bobra.176_1s0005.1